MACGNNSKMSKSASGSSNSSSSSRSSKSASEKIESSKEADSLFIAWIDPSCGFYRKGDFFIRLFEIMDYIILS